MGRKFLWVFGWLWGAVFASEFHDFEVDHGHRRPPVLLADLSNTTFESPFYEIISSSHDPALLSCLGGGTRGITTATILEEIEKHGGFDSKDVHHFAGTSTGGLIAAAKATGMDTQSVVDIYENHAGEIFYNSKVPLWQQLKQLFAEKYNDRAFIKLDQKYFSKKKTLGSLNKQLILVAYDVTGGPELKPGPFIMDSFGNEEVRSMKIWECLRSTTAAPSYFPPFQTKNNRSNTDGGMCNNDPTITAYGRILKARREYHLPPLQNLGVVTIGTGYQYESKSQESAKNMGILELAPDILDWTMGASQQLAHQQACDIFGDRYVYLNPELHRTVPDLDDASPKNITFLQNVALEYVKENPYLIDKAGRLLQGLPLSGE